MSFLDFAQSHGVLVPRLHVVDRVQRCPTVDHPKSKNGAWFWDGHRGYVFAWDGQAKAHWYDSPDAKPWTPAEKAQWQAKRTAAANAQQEAYARAAKKAQQMLADCELASHDYLTRKGFANTQGFVLDGDLLIPMRNFETDQLQGLQVIRWLPNEMRFEKKMLPGMRAKGAVLRLAKTAPETIYVEGYATGLSVDAAARSVGLRLCVMVCFSAGNLVQVAQQGKGFVFADNDASGAGQAAAIATGLPWCMGDTIGFDANDEHQKNGLLAVAKKLMEVRRSTA